MFHSGLGIASMRSHTYRACLPALMFTVMRSHTYRACLLGLVFTVGGCVPAYKTRYQFDNHHIPKERWARLQKECDYDADKASAAANLRISAYVWEELYLKCLDLHGAKYLGKIRVPVE
jgi:hypothetical protein